jgi:hypothetical protein
MPTPDSKNTLVVYGDMPPAEDEAHPGRMLFDGHLNHRNRRSFERLLLRELGRLVDRDLQGATIEPLRTRADLPRVFRRGAYSSVIFYGHTIDITAHGPVQGRQELALRGNGEFIGAADWANALKAAGVTETVIAGCSSVSFAAGVSAAAPAIRAGGLYSSRSDRIKGDANAIIDFQIVKQPIKWWPR